MSISRTRAAAVIGVEGFVVDVEAAVTAGVPGLHLYGLPETSFSEVRDRVRAAIHNSGLLWPNRHVTVGLHPVSLPKHGSGYDLVIAIAILAANGTIPEAVGTGAVYLAELGLDGTLRPIEAILPGALSAVAAGYSTIVVAGANAAEASAAPGTTVVAADTLTDIV